MVMKTYLSISLCRTTVDDGAKNIQNKKVKKKESQKKRNFVGQNEMRRKCPTRILYFLWS